MKYILTFLFGGACGAGAMLLLFRKEIKKELESRETAENCDEMPFTMGEGNDSEKDTKSLREAKNGLRSENDAVMAVRKDTKIAYHKIVQETKDNSIPVTPRDEDLFKKADVPDVIKAEPPEEFVDAIPISKDEFKEDNGNEKEQYVYFRGDHIMATESGKIIPNPAMLIGPSWENYIGDYAKNTAYIRNPNLVTDYEILVDDGLYEDEYGSDYLRED